VDVNEGYHLVRTRSGKYGVIDYPWKSAWSWKLARGLFPDVTGGEQPESSTFEISRPCPYTPFPALEPVSSGQHHSNM
jgi:hypothetical protein